METVGCTLSAEGRVACQNNGEMDITPVMDAVNKAKRRARGVENALHTHHLCNQITKTGNRKKQNRRQIEIHHQSAFGRKL